ncbi:hypothetical protein IV203_010738 [Nitzschia inconspicua]|uniref:Uncharacterized protein n=1 Tax=Nitzschia inconspicua TaxID=303405 RepID=A0A9K3KY37_9STRA|nr:hypothetical protein IV203_010738 [Nitzschia inconspicua]
MPSIITPYKNIESFDGDGFIRDGRSNNTSNSHHHNNNSGGGDLFRLHRDYLQGLDSGFVEKLPWSTPEEKLRVGKLLHQRSWAKSGWSRGVTGIVYSLLTSIIVIVLLIPRVQQRQRDELRLVGVSLAAWNALLLVGTTCLYCYYAQVDHNIQQLVRRLMDETGIGVPPMPAGTPAMHRDDSSQQGIFELPEFINILWQRASLTTPSQQQCPTGSNSLSSSSSSTPPPSDQISAITFG